MRAQQGQAIVEMVAVAAVLLLMGAALLWLQRWQEIKVQTQHHAALLAFRHAVSHGLNGVKPPQYLEGLHSPLSHELFSSEHSLANQSHWQPLQMARLESLLGETTRTRFTVQAQEQHSDQWVAWPIGRPALLDAMQVHSQISIAVGTGSAESSLQAVERLAQHGPLWRQSEQASQTAFKTLTPLLHVVDTGWSRTQPQLQWLHPWKESIPNDFQP